MIKLFNKIKNSLNLDNNDAGYSLAYIIAVMMIIMLMIASSYTMLVSSFRLNNDNWLDEQAYLASKSAVDIVASQFCEGTNEAEELYEFYVLNNCRGFQIHDFNADFQQDFKTEVELALISQNKLAILAVSTNGRAAKGVIVYLKSNRVIEEIDYYENFILYRDDYAPPFFITGYEVINNIEGSEINIDDFIVVGTPEDIITPGEEETKIGTTDATYYIRLDGTIPYEPSSYGTDLYTKGIHISKCMVEDKAIANDFDALAANLAIVPTSAQIKKVYPSYNPSYQYVLWYVSKLENDGWHIDGVLLDKTMHNVTYNPNFDEWDLKTNGSVPSGTQCKAGDIYYIDSAASQNLKRSGFYLGGWIRSDTHDVIGVNGWFVMPSNNVTLMAKWVPNWVQVQFMMNDETVSVYQTQQVTIGNLVKKPPNPARDEWYTLKDGTTGPYYAFDGWYTSIKGTEKWDFATRYPDAHMNLYAHWRIINENIKFVDFMLNSGDFTSIYKRQYTLKYDTVVNPGVPERLGYIFTGWYDSPYGDTLFNFNQEITENTKVYAHWVEALKVRYASDDLPTSIPNDYKLENDLVTVNSTILTKSGKYFGGWIPDFDDSAVLFGGDEFNMPETDITLNARWCNSPVDFVVRYDANYPEGVTTVSGIMDDTIVSGLNKVKINANSYYCEKLEPHIYDVRQQAVVTEDALLPSLGDGDEYYLHASTGMTPKLPIKISIKEAKKTSSSQSSSGKLTYSYDKDDKVSGVNITVTLAKPKYKKHSSPKYWKYPLTVIQTAINNTLTSEVKNYLGIQQISLYVADSWGNNHGFRGSDTIFYVYNDKYSDFDATKIYFKDLNADKPEIFTVYRFDSWNTRPDGLGITFYPGDIWKSSNTNGEVLDLYAQWVED